MSGKPTLRLSTWLFLILLGLNQSGCRYAGPQAAAGGAFGGLTGGLAGAAIGATEGKAPEGALIGALAGATLGANAGHAADNEIERQRIEHQSQLDYQRASAIRIDQVVQMSKSGLSREVIARQIANQGVARRPTIDELIALKQQGVSDVVIEALQNAPIAGQAPVTRVLPGPAPIVVESVAPWTYHRPGCGPYRRPRPRAGFSVRF